MLLDERWRYVRTGHTVRRILGDSPSVTVGGGPESRSHIEDIRVWGRRLSDAHQGLLVVRDVSVGVTCNSK